MLSGFSPALLKLVLEGGEEEEEVEVMVDGEKADQEGESDSSGYSS